MTPYSDPAKEAAYQLEYRQINKERLTENARIWREKNAEVLKEKKRQDYLKNKDAYKARAKASQGRRAEEIKALRSTPKYKEERNSRRRERYASDANYRETLNAQIRESWHRRDGWKKRFGHSIGDAVSRGAEIVDRASIKEFYRQVFSKSKNTCQYCRGVFPIEDITVDHKQTYSLGGKHEVSNLAVSCITCNIKKGAIPFDSWMAQKG